MQETDFDKKDFYELDSVGYVIKRNFLSDEEVNLINQVIDNFLGDENPVKFPFLELHPIFMNIMSNKWTMGACSKVNGEYFRFDHCVGIQQPGRIREGRTGEWVTLGKGGFHGGPNCSSDSCFFNVEAGINPKILAGSVSMGIALTDQTNETGGFAYIAGSHKSSFILDGRSVLQEVLSGDFTSDCVCTPTLRAGDISFFSESLIHGMSPLQNKNKRRRALYYKYSPGYMAWRPYKEIKKYCDLVKTPLQARLLQPPYVAGYDDSEIYNGDNVRKEKTIQ